LSHAGTSGQPYRFAGEHYDPEAGMQYHRARWYDPAIGRFTALDPFSGALSRPATLHKYAYAGGDPVNNADPSGEMTLGGVSAGLNGLASLGRVTVSLVKFINKAQNFMDVVHAIRSIGELLQGGVLSQYQHYLPDSQSAVKSLNIKEATETLQANLPRIMSRAFTPWVAYLALKRPSDIRGYIIYLPNPEPAVLPQMRIPIPLKIGKKSVELIAGGTQHAGRLIGVGLDIPSDSPGKHQVWRMDYHNFHRNSGGTGSSWADPKKEISVWRDGDYHFHVMKPPR
jgi:RHS repeat-associated protein